MYKRNSMEVPQGRLGLLIISGSQVNSCDNMNILKLISQDRDN